MAVLNKMLIKFSLYHRYVIKLSLTLTEYEMRTQHECVTVMFSSSMQSQGVCTYFGRRLDLVPKAYKSRKMSTEIKKGLKILTFWRNRLSNCFK